MSGRKTNDSMDQFVINEIKQFLKLKKKIVKNSKILIIGLSYKAGIADLRNSINLKIFNKKVKISAQPQTLFNDFLKIYYIRERSGKSARIKEKIN